MAALFRSGVPCHPQGFWLAEPLRGRGTGESHLVGHRPHARAWRVPVEQPAELRSEKDVVGSQGAGTTKKSEPKNHQHVSQYNHGVTTLPVRRAQRFAEKARASRARPCSSGVRSGTRRAGAGSISSKAMRRDIQPRAAAAATANIVRTATRAKFCRVIMAFLRKVRTCAGQLASQSQFIESKNVISIEGTRSCG